MTKHPHRRFPFLVSLAIGAGCLSVAAGPLVVEGIDPLPAGGFREDNIGRALRYRPADRGFVITNGTGFFNRPLYGGSSAFRVDAGDLPEFSLYLPGRGGNLRLGFRMDAGTKWLHEAAKVTSIYQDGAMSYEVRDPWLGDGVIRLVAIAARSREGLLVRAEFEGIGEPRLVFAFGGVDGWKGRRGGDLGCEPEPIASLFRMRPQRCEGNEVSIEGGRFTIRGKPGVVGGSFPPRTRIAVADAAHWDDVDRLFKRGDGPPRHPVVAGRIRLVPDEPGFFGIQRLASGEAVDLWPAEELSDVFRKEQETLRRIAGRLVVETPDPFIDSAVAALNVAEDAVWHDSQNVYLHGGVAWRVPLLGWRVSYAGDVLGDHDRTASHFAHFARKQNTEPPPGEIPPPEESAHLARNETALHSNGNLTDNHYDMNLVGVDAFFRHLLWTGDLDFARRMWPVIERHFAWERRLFRREFGDGKLPLYEAYACIWASDDLAYNGGGATHATAYNLYHNRMAARVAALLGEDPAPYEQEAELIAKAMREHLWLTDRGWFAEWKDLLGRQLVHPEAAAWTFYHTLDSEVPTPFEAWQMTRFTDTRIARFPLRGPGIPDGLHTMPTTSWMPYTWSLNNVVFGEMMHTSLGYWQANRRDGAFPLFKGALVDSMFAGACPGNVGMCTWFDANRRESQRDFSDGVGAMARAVMDGLFGVKPDLLAGEVTVRPGFPTEWDHASVRHPDFTFAFRRDGTSERFEFSNRFGRPLRVTLQAPAFRTGIERVTVNGKAAGWTLADDEVGLPRIVVAGDASPGTVIEIRWAGDPPRRALSLGAVDEGEPVSAECGVGILEIADPQEALEEESIELSGLTGEAAGTPGHRSVFARVTQGELQWWLPVSFEIRSKGNDPEPVDWSKPVAGKTDPVDLTHVYNAAVTDLFRNDYRAPRSPFVSLAVPRQGIGSWCHPDASFEVDDSGLRALAAKSEGRIELPNGVPIATPGDPEGNNIAFVSQWRNHPVEIQFPLSGKARRAYFLMAGSTDAMKSRIDNGEVVVAYQDGSTARLALRNPDTWWPIDQDYFIDDFAFAIDAPLPPRIDLRTGTIRLLDRGTFAGKGGGVPGGAATVLNLPLDPSKPLATLTLRAIVNEVVIGLMGVTLER